MIVLDTRNGVNRPLHAKQRRRLSTRHPQTDAGLQDSFSPKSLQVGQFSRAGMGQFGGASKASTSSVIRTDGTLAWKHQMAKNTFLS